MNTVFQYMAEAAKLANEKSLEHGLILDLKLTNYGIVVDGQTTHVAIGVRGGVINATQHVHYTDLADAKFNLLEEKVRTVVAQLLGARALKG